MAGSSFVSQIHFPFSWTEVARAIWQKYPNPMAQHVISVDVLERSVDQNGLIRTERIIGVEQNAPRWVLKLIGSDSHTFVREVTFIVPHIPHLDQHPAVLQASINLSLAKVLTCHERISYLPNSEVLTSAFDSIALTSPSTTFHQLATFIAKGKLAKGQAWEAVGKRVEKVSVDRFDSNASVGRQGFEFVLNQLYGNRTPP